MEEKSNKKVHFKKTAKKNLKYTKLVINKKKENSYFKNLIFLKKYPNLYFEFTYF